MINFTIGGGIHTTFINKIPVDNTFFLLIKYSILQFMYTVI